MGKEKLNPRLTIEQIKETFKINETNKVTFDENEEVASLLVRTHARGDKGTHAIMFFKVDWANLQFELLKGICSGDDNK